MPWQLAALRGLGVAQRAIHRTILTMQESEGRFVHLADVGDLVTARVCAAVLEDAGIEARLHGDALGPYPVTVGRLAVTQVWVRHSDLEEARLVMLESEIEDTLGARLTSGSIAHPNSLPMRLMALLVGTLLVLAVAWELMRVF